MANFNKVILIGRMTRDPEVRTFGSGGKVASFGFAVTNRKKNPQSGQWEDDPMFIDVSAFQSGTGGTLADRVGQYCRKGALLCVEGRLILDTWDDKTTGQKRQKHKIHADTVEFLETRAEAEARQARMGGMAPAAVPAHVDNGGYSAPPQETSAPHAESGDDIPF
jgi:single-strand DNA-binding protein